MSYPSTYGVINAVTIRFVCGYANAAAVPVMLKAAMLEHVRASEMRDAEDATKVLAWVDRQVWPFKAF